MNSVLATGGETTTTLSCAAQAPKSEALTANQMKRLNTVFTVSLLLRRRLKVKNSLAQTEPTETVFNERSWSRLRLDPQGCAEFSVVLMIWLF